MGILQNEGLNGYIFLFSFGIDTMSLNFLGYFSLLLQLFRETSSEKSTKPHNPIPKGSMGRRIELLHVLNTNEI